MTDPSAAAPSPDGKHRQHSHLLFGDEHVVGFFRFVLTVAHEWARVTRVDHVSFCIDASASLRTGLFWLRLQVRKKPVMALVGHVSSNTYHFSLLVRLSAHGSLVRAGMFKDLKSSVSDDKQPTQNCSYVFHRNNLKRSFSGLFCARERPSATDLLFGVCSWSLVLL